MGSEVDVQRDGDGAVGEVAGPDGGVAWYGREALGGDVLVDGDDLLVEQDGLLHGIEVAFAVLWCHGRAGFR